MPRQFSDTEVNRIYPMLDLFRSIATFLALIVWFSSLLGCNGKDGSIGKGPDETDWQLQVHSQLDGQQIRSSVLSTYAEADAYSDNAILSLSYRLQGSYLEEPHQWKVRFHRGKGLTADVYEGRIKADVNRLFCFVYDFSCRNLDDQWQVHPVEDSCSILSLVQKLFQDGICRHYLTGQHGLPINNKNRLAGETFFPPTIALLDGKNIPDWLANSDVVRLPDATNGKATSIQLKLTHESMSWTVAIDPDSFLIQSVVYPNELLDSRLQDNPEVVELVVKAKFQEATLTPNLDVGVFQATPPAKAKLVRQFVAVPEPFPSNHIGKATDAMVLRDANGGEVTAAHWKGKVTLLWWMNDAEDITAIPQLTQISNKLSPKEFNIARVRSLHGVLPSNTMALEKVQEESKQNSIPLLADFGFSAGRAIGLQQYPMLAVLDRDGVLQYVKSLDSQNPVAAEELLALLDRVRNGDNVAKEMRQEYESFLDVYHERLVEVRAEPSETFDRRQVRNALAQSSPFAKTTLIAEQLETITSLKQPGNMSMFGRGNKITSIVLDGWRTLIPTQIDGGKGKPVTLDLKDKESISIVKKGQADNGNLIVYSEMGTTVRLLTPDLNVQKLVETENVQQRIRSAELADVDGDGVEEIVVAFTGTRGVVAFNVDSNQSRTICREPVRSFAIVSTDKMKRAIVYSSQQAKLKMLLLEKQNAAPEDLKCDLVSVTKIVAGADSKNRYHLCVIGTNQQGEWNAVGLNGSMKKAWQHRIGSQRFAMQTEAVRYAHIRGADGGLWVIATADDRDPQLHFASDDGTLFESTTLFGSDSILGVDIASKGNRYLLRVAGGSQVQSWWLQIPGINAQSTSSSQ